MSGISGLKKASVKKICVSFSDRIDQNLQQEKSIFPTIKPGVTYPEFPADLTTLSPKDLGQLQTLYTAWANYIDEILSLDICDMNYYEDAKDYAYTVVKLQTKGKLHEKRDSASIDLQTREEHMKYLELKSRVEILKAKLRSCERAWRAISRELSRRQINLELEN